MATTLPCGVIYRLPAERGSSRRVTVTFAGENCGVFFLNSPSMVQPGPYLELRSVAQALAHRFPEHRFQLPVLLLGEELALGRHGLERDLLSQHLSGGDHASLALADAGNSNDPALIALARTFVDLQGEVKAAIGKAAARWSEQQAA